MTKAKTKEQVYEQAILANEIIKGLVGIDYCYHGMAWIWLYKEGKSPEEVFDFMVEIAIAAVKADSISQFNSDLIKDFCEKYKTKIAKLRMLGYGSSTMGYADFLIEMIERANYTNISVFSIFRLIERVDCLPRIVPPGDGKDLDDEWKRQ